MKRIHCAAEKEWLKAEIRRDGSGSWIGHPEMGPDEACAMVDACPTTFVPVGDDCDNRDEHGVCRGHEIPDPSRPVDLGYARPRGRDGGS